MELGLDFDFEEEEEDKKDKIGDRHVPYNVKICTEQWFDGALQSCTDNENSKEVDLEQYQQMLKFSADLSYHGRDYQAAVKKYKELLGLLSSRISSALGHDVQESLSRCYIYTGQSEEGLLIARKMVESASKDDVARQQQALSLLSFASEKSKKWFECVDALERLCELQPQFPQTWLKLGAIYDHLKRDADDEMLLIKQLSCYLRAKFLFQSVLGTVSDFIYDRNMAVIQQLNLKIEKVPLLNSRKEFASEFILKEVENQATSYKEVSNAKQSATGEPPCRSTFYDKFCSWISHCTN